MPLSVSVMYFFRLSRLLVTHLSFFRLSQTVSDPPQSKDSSSITINQNLSFEAVKKSVSTLEGQLEHFCQQEVMKISAGWSHSFSVFTLLMHVVTNSASSIFGMH